MPKGAALITGASSGIGAELAKLCAADGYDLVLVARSMGRLEEMAAELAEAHRVQVRPLATDLSDPTAPDQIFHAMSGAPDLLINNAGFGLRGAFHQTDWLTEQRMIQVNITALVHL